MKKVFVLLAFKRQRASRVMTLSLSPRQGGMTRGRVT